MKRRHGRLTGVAALLTALLAALVAPFALSSVAGAQESEDVKGLLAIRQIDSSGEGGQVKVTFLWTGSQDALPKLTLREDGVAKDVKIDDLRKTEQRLGTVVVIDTSGSMADDGALTRAKAGVVEMARNLDDGDQIALVSFNDVVEVESPFTNDPAQITAALDSMANPSDGATAMYDGLDRAAKLFSSRPNLQPNILLIGDGGDDESTATAATARAAVANSGAALFTVNMTHLAGIDTDFVSSVTARTGGAMFGGTTEAEVAEAFSKISQTMRSQFVGSYTSTAKQGDVSLALTVGGVEETASFVVGSKATGAATESVQIADKAFGPSWLRGTGGVAAALILMGLAVGLGAYCFANLVTKDENSLGAMLRPYEEGGPGPEGNEGSLAQTAFLQRAVEMTEDFAERQGFLEKVEHKLERADLPLRAAEALFFYACGVFVVALAGFFGLGLLPGLILAFVAAAFPPAFLNFKAGRRAKKFVGQLPDTLNLLSGSLRAGYSLMQGVEAVSQEVQEPMGKELRRVVTEARLGREIEDAMESVAERLDSPDFAWAVMAVRIQREVGGNLSELLLTVADTMVHRDRLRRDVSALTAEGKISAIILGLLPVGLGAFMWMSNPKYMAPLSETFMGKVMLGVAALAAGIGFIWMKKTIDIEI